jgi:hypothetical protein
MERRMNDGYLATTDFERVDFPEPDVRQQIVQLTRKVEATRDAACHKCDAAIIRILRLEIRLQFRRHLRVDFGHRVIRF